jgi:hypothetical protein
MQRGDENLCRKSENKRTVGRLWYRYDDDIEVGLKDIASKVVDLIELTHDGVQWKSVLKKLKILEIFTEQRTC